MSHDLSSKVIILGEKAVAWVNSIRTGDVSSREDIGDVEVRLRGVCRTDAHGFVCKLHMQRVAIALGVDRHTGNAHLSACANHTQCNLTAVGDEDFFEHISHTIEKNKNDSQMFFSGYDCDSLAFDKISGFSDQLIQFFEKYQNVEVELRTKSVVTKSLIKRPAIKNCIIAFSLSPNKIAEKLDNKAPSIRRRIKAMKDLADCGWLIGLRFDPLIYTNDWNVQYSELICEIMGQINVPSIHPGSYG